MFTRPQDGPPAAPLIRFQAIVPHRAPSDGFFKPRCERERQIGPLTPFSMVLPIHRQQGDVLRQTGTKRPICGREQRTAWRTSVKPASFLCEHRRICDARCRWNASSANAAPWCRMNSHAGIEKAELRPDQAAHVCAPGPASLECRMTADGSKIEGEEQLWPSSAKLVVCICALDASRTGGLM